MDKLQQAREAISRIDGEMADLFVRRMEAAAQVAEYKKERGLPIFDGAREQEVLEKGSARVSDPVLREHYVRFLQNNMDVSKAYQRQLLEGMRVAYSGSEGAFAHIAAGEIFPQAVLVGHPNFQEAYQAVVSGGCDCAVLPLENSSAGEVGQVTDMMFDGGLYVNGVYELAVRHDLLALPGAELAGIRTVISHPQALAQCAPYLQKRGWQTREYANTALAARLVAESGDRSLAAIASARTAGFYGLQVLEENIHRSGSSPPASACFPARKTPPWASGWETISFCCSPPATRRGRWPGPSTSSAGTASICAPSAAVPGRTCCGNITFMWRWRATSAAKTAGPCCRSCPAAATGCGWPAPLPPTAASERGSACEPADGAGPQQL